MADQPLLAEDILSSPAFRRDLRSFLDLSVETLLHISDIGNRLARFAGDSQAQSLNNQFNVPVGKAMRDLRVAEYLYGRVAETGLEVDSAVEEIVSFAATLDRPVEIADEKRRAFEAILSFNQEHDIASANARSLRGVPHFVDANGSWTIRPVRNRAREIVKVPVVTMSISWHDSSGNDHEAFFYMSERDLDRISESLSSLADSRRDIEEIL